MRGRANVGAVVSVVVGLMMTGCGGSSGSDSSESLKVVAAAAETTADQDSARTSSVAQGSSDGRPYTMRTKGSIDFRSGDFEQRTKGSEPALSNEIRVVDGVMYIKSALRALAVPGGDTLTGKPWTTISGDDDLAAEDPAAILAKLRSVTDADRVGDETVRGVNATRYRLKVNPAKARATDPSIPTERLRDLDTIEVWIDAAGRLRKVRIAGRDGAGTGSVTSEYYDFGVPVAVKAPPADQVFDIVPQ